MQLVKMFRILEIHATHILNAPFKLILEGIDDNCFGTKSELIMDQEACDRHT